jgi:hypothetical protein
MLSVHDVLTGWQAGEITTARAMRMTGADDVMELYALASQSGVELRVGLLPREEEQARRATDLIRRLPRKKGRMSWAVPIATAGK